VPKEPCIRRSAHQRNLVNITEPSMCGDDTAFLSNYFDHLLSLYDCSGLVCDECALEETGEADIRGHRGLHGGLYAASTVLILDIGHVNI